MLTPPPPHPQAGRCHAGTGNVCIYVLVPSTYLRSYQEKHLINAFADMKMNDYMHRARGAGIHLVPEPPHLLERAMKYRELVIENVGNPASRLHDEFNEFCLA